MTSTGLTSHRMIRRWTLYVRPVDDDVRFVHAVEQARKLVVSV